MSRRRDQQRHEAMKRLDPDYKGFRGHGSEPSLPGNVPLEQVTCSVCGRKRNVPRGIAVEQGEGYVCSRCSEQGAVAEESKADRQA